MGNVTEFTESNFSQEVLQSSEPVLVDFWAPWCAPCRMIGPVIDELASEYRGAVKIGKVNIDDNPGPAQSYNVMNIPTLLLFKGGEVVERFVGVQPKAKLQKARELGASEVIDHHKQDVAAEIKRLTNRRGVDVVIEHVGEATWVGAVRSLARGGRLVTCGATTGYRATIDLRVLFVRQLSLLGSFMGTKGELLRAARFFFAGQLKPVIDRTYPLTQAADAQRRLEASEQFGKIVLEV